ncbi:MAG: efflux RND transporter periplasmic adaptor subunit [Lachnospiraceae bacterium]|nr:efflux RND transporter periplasmic adaptor subunit [Lachnospiraceae bacterium]
MEGMNEKEKKSRKEIIKNILIIFLIVMLILTFFSNTIMNYSLPEISTATATPGNVVSKVRGNGTVQTAEDYEVRVTENKSVASVKIKVGDEVKAGDLLFELADGSLTAGAAVGESAIGEGTEPEKDSETKTAEEALDELELDYNKALLDLAPSYAQDNLDIKNAQEDLQIAIEKQQRSGSRAGVVAELAATEKQIETLTVEADALQQEMDTVSGNALKKTSKKLAKKKAELAELTAKKDRLTTEAESIPDPEAAAEDVRAKQRALDALLVGLSEKKREDGSTSGKTSLDMADKRKKIAKQKEEVEKLHKKQNADPLKIYSQNDGVVTAINCIAGDAVTPDSALATIAVTGNGYSVKFSVTKEQAKLVRQGQEADILNIFGDDIKASLNSIRPDLQNPNNNKELIFAITGEDVTVGQELELSVGEKGSGYDVVVPNSAIRKDASGDFVLVVNVKSSPLGNRYVLSRADVDVLASDDTNSAVSGGVYQYEYVVTNSSKPLEAGMKVRLANE